MLAVVNNRVLLVLLLLLHSVMNLGFSPEDTAAVHSLFENAQRQKLYDPGQYPLLLLLVVPSWLGDMLRQHSQELPP
jgi:hypothetical protein